MYRTNLFTSLIIVSASYFLQTTAYSHGLGPRGIQILDWHTKDISRVVSFTPYDIPGSVVEVDGRQCLKGYQFYFDVLDNLAFDVDEEIQIEVDFDRSASTDTVILEYDRNGVPHSKVVVDLPLQSHSQFYTAKVKLDRARFAGRMDFASDFKISAFSGGSTDPRDVRSHMTICNIIVSRSFSTNNEVRYGWLNLTVLNERGQATPVRMSILDKSGRAPLPNESALTVKDFSNNTRTILLPGGTVNWPSENRYAFYIDGVYRTRLPVGEYSVVITKGLEYRYLQKKVTITNGVTHNEILSLERWIDMPSSGWMSGDLHVHVPRTDASENRSLLLQAQAEDLHITNSVQMGNIAATHFPQSFWGRNGRYGSGLYFLIAGQEDPRTAIRGHTLHLKLEQPVRYPDQYLQYNEVFESVAMQGGISGYAHLNVLGAYVGMALDVPSGLVSFVEVLQRGIIDTELWFDFLNLGYKIAPAAGSDVPYGARIGDVRNFVRMDEVRSPDSWFAGLSDGRTFVTNGPIVQLELNEFEIGDEVSLSKGTPFRISADVSINPDIDILDRIELVEQGDVIDVVRSDSGGTSLSLSYESTANRSSWFVAIAYGKKQNVGVGSVVALTAPIYVVVDGERTWKRDQVKDIATKMKAEIDSFANLTLEEAGHLDEWFETREAWTSNWPDQIRQIQLRAQQARAEIDSLVRLSAN